MASSNMQDTDIIRSEDGPDQNVPTQSKINMILFATVIFLTISLNVSL